LSSLGEDCRRSAKIGDDALLSFLDRPNYNRCTPDQPPETISMKKISIAFLAAMSLASFGCKKKGAGEAIAKMAEFKDKMCACKDKACTEKVSEDMTKWSQEAAKAGGDKEAKVTEDDAKKMAVVTEEMTKCMTKIMTEAAGAMGGTPPAGGAAGGTPPAGGAAEPAAGGAAPAGGAAEPPAGGAAPAGGSADGSAK
jgi:hypothetical protein